MSGLHYPIQDPLVLIGSKSGTTRTGVALVDYYNLDGTTTKVFDTPEASKLELNGVYTAGSGETSNSIQIIVEASSDRTNWYRLLNETVSDGTSTLSQREFTLVQSTTYGTLAYDNQSANFTEGLKITGGTSGATAYIESDSDSGTTGTLTLSNVSGGPFQNDEQITDTAGSPGTADVNGILTSITSFSLPLDISNKYHRISVKESGVSSNAGTIFVEAIISGR